jgi:hypothetical protein
MLGFLCAMGLASCQVAAYNGGYQTVYQPNGYLLTNNQGVTFWSTSHPGPFVATHITVVRTHGGSQSEVIYPPGTPFYAPNLSSKFSD